MKKLITTLLVGLTLTSVGGSIIGLHNNNTKGVGNGKTITISYKNMYTNGYPINMKIPNVNIFYKNQHHYGYILKANVGNIKQSINLGGTKNNTMSNSGFKTGSFLPGKGVNFKHSGTSQWNITNGMIKDPNAKFNWNLNFQTGVYWGADQETHWKNISASGTFSDIYLWHPGNNPISNALVSGKKVSILSMSEGVNLNLKEHYAGGWGDYNYILGGEVYLKSVTYLIQ